MSNVSLLCTLNVNDSLISAKISTLTSLTKMTSNRILFAVFRICFVFLLSSKSENQDIIFPDDERHSLFTTRELLTSRSGTTHCLTPQREIGTCVPATKCSVLKKLLTFKEKPKVCSWNSLLPTICCPINYLTSRTKFQRQWKPKTSFYPENPNIQKDKYENFNHCGTRKALHEILPVYSRSRVITTSRAPFKGEWPWMVVIFVETAEGSKYLCGGTIITDRFILSVAHCFMSPQYLYSDYTIKVGAVNVSEGDIYRVNSVVIHPSFNPMYHYNDIAIIRTEEPIRFTDNVRPICLPFRRKIYPGSPVTVTGYGDTEFGGKRSDILLAANLKIVSNEICNKSYSTLESRALFNGITKQMVCAGSEDGKNDACQNDSGSPLVYYDKQKRRWYIIGIVSFGHRCADPKFPGVYSKVAFYIHWILSVVDLHKSKIPFGLSNTDSLY